MRVPISAIDLDMGTYPRKGIRQEVVEQYADALRGGAAFPPILLENKTNKLLSGLHRIEAVEKVLKQPELWENGHKPDGTIEADYLAAPESIPRKLFRASLDATHGLRLSPEETKALAREVYQANPDFKQKDCAKLLGVSNNSISRWVQDILAARREERQHKAWKLQLLGWTEREIAQALNVSPATAHEDCSKSSEWKKSSNSLLSAGHPVEEVARRFNLSPLLVWAAHLKGKDDRARMGALGWPIRTWDYWNWSDVDHRFGDEWDGRIPAQLVAHALYFFTRPGALVLDPMAGGGTVSDVCLAMGRRCRSYDMAARPERRPEIEEWRWDPKDLRWAPSAREKPDLIFFDPPYYKKNEKEYGERSISALPRLDYLRFFREWAALAWANSKPETRLALLEADWRDFQSTPALEEKPDEAVTLLDYVREVSPTGRGWQLTHRIESPLSTERFTAGVVSAMQEARILGAVSRTLLVFRRTHDSV
ncbi:MAG: MerR family transcriptional regulator [Chloroflexota bacterium]|nr:MerR family transcriptional regulator [Chloroflexota bacterium]